MKSVEAKSNASNKAGGVNKILHVTLNKYIFYFNKLK